MMRILLIGSPPNVAKFAQHLAAYGEVEFVYPEKLGEVPYGTAWVICMNSGHTPGTVFAAAGRVGAKCVHIPAAWSHAQEKLEAVGFFKAAARAKGELPGRGEEPRPVNALTQRPFAGIADALARKAREKEEAEQKIQAAIERGLNPPPVEPEPEPEPEEAFEDDAVESEASAAAPAQSTQVDEALPEAGVLTQSEDAPVEVPGMQDDEGRHVFTRDDRALAALSRRVRSDAKESRLRQLFEWNPDLAITDAQAMLAAVAHDGRALQWTRMSDIRDEVREARGLPVGVRRATRLVRSLAPKLTHEEHPPIAAGPPAALVMPKEVPMPPPTLTVAPGPAPGASLPLPREVADASRLLGEYLAAAGIVGSFTLTWQKGDVKPRVKWRPDLGEADADL